MEFKLTAKVASIEFKLTAKVASIEFKLTTKVASIEKLIAKVDSIVALRLNLYMFSHPLDHDVPAMQVDEHSWTSWASEQRLQA